MAIKIIFAKGEISMREQKEKEEEKIAHGAIVGY